MPLVVGWFSWGKRHEVAVDKIHIAKKAILEDCIVGGVRRIQIGDFDPSAGDEIAILGQSKIWILSCDDYHLIKSYSFKADRGKTFSFGTSPELIDVNHDGSFEIVRGGGGGKEVGLLDAKGKTLWTFDSGARSKPYKMIAGDLNRDNNIEFYVADRTGLYQLDHRGNIVKRFSNAWINDINISNDISLQSPLLITLTHKGEFLCFNFDGKVVNTLSPSYKVRRFGIVSWPNGQNILIGEGFFRWNIHLFSLGGIDIFNYKLSIYWSYYGPQGVGVRFNKEEAPYLAILGHAKVPAYLSQLNIFSPSGELVYQEVLGKTRGLCVNSCAKDGNQVLLIGDGNTTVWAYSVTRD
jgi:hypothetical protein